MGQFALGLRSLFIKTAIFVVMAALLAWALGGTLWPKPSVVDLPAVTADGTAWWWRLAVGGSEEAPRWTMMRSVDGTGTLAFPPDQEPLVFAEAAGPVAANKVVAFAGVLRNGQSASNWRLYIAEVTSMNAMVHSMPDRLAVEQQLARVAAGLPIQDAQTILRQREAVLDPK